MKVHKNCDLLDGGPCPACQDYTALEAEISAARQVLDDLIAQRPGIRTRINEEHDTLRTRVPLEIVSSVFQFAAEMRDDESHYSNRSSRKTSTSGPLLLGKICKAWRDIAWSTRTLWTVLSINLDSVKTLNKVRFMREWLERAGLLLPLSIRISSIYDSRRPKKEMKTINQIVAIINERSNQWEDMKIIGPSWLVSLVSGGPEGAPNLKSLCIRSPGTNEENTFSLVGGVPQPRYLVLDRCTLRSVHIDCTSLVCVYFTETSMPEMIELLQHAPNLKYCAINSIDFLVDYARPAQPIIHRNLESLNCGSPCPGRQPGPEENILFVTLLKIFIFPCLQHLAINGSTMEDDAQVPWDIVLSYITVHSPPLISFRIQFCALHLLDEVIIPILHRTPLLRELEIIPNDYPKADGELEPRQFGKLFQLLADTSAPSTDISEASNAQTEFLPNLQYLKLHVLDEEAALLWPVIPRIFGPISEIHNPRRRPLKTLVIRVEAQGFQYFEIKSKAHLLRLVELREKGIDIDIRTDDERVDVLDDSMLRRGLALAPSPEPDEDARYSSSRVCLGTYSERPSMRRNRLLSYESGSDSDSE